MTGLFAVRMPRCSWMAFLKTAAAFIARNLCAVCRARTGQGKCGAERWGERLGRAVPLNTSPQLGVNNDSVLGLYCFWLGAFFRNNWNSCQGSFCPQLRGKNKEQRWECPIWFQFPETPRKDSRRGCHRHGLGYSCVHFQLGRPLSCMLLRCTFLYLIQSRGLCLY